MMNGTGKHAIVIGAGIGGLLFARVLADHFKRVTVLERDSLSETKEPRNGVPQGRHFHGLLAGGCHAMDVLLPGLVDDFKATGAVQVKSGLTTLYEMPGYDPFPRRESGLCSYALSRPLLELCIRRRVQAITNISWEPNSNVERLQHEAGAVTGVVTRDGRSLAADFVIDATGTGDLTLKTFKEMGHPLPHETTVGVDLRYVTAIFEIPPDVNYDWNVLVTYPDMAPGSKGGMLSTIEGNRWICCIVWQTKEEAPVDRDSFIAATRQLRTQTCYNALKNARMLGKVNGYLFSDSRHRHFSQLKDLPGNLLPVADVICSFNPAHGQGMSVAALEAEALHGLLKDGHSDLNDLSRAFLQRTDEIIAAPWNMSALPDFASPLTRGERPPNLMEFLKFGAAFTELAARDGDVHRLMLEIRGLVKPYSALTSDPVLMQRIHGVMMEMQQAEMAQAAAV